MASKTSYELHHNFPKLAEESGFTFNNIRPRIHIDWNKIRLIDIDYLIKERKFCLIEQHMNDVLNCVLESEFDVRILNESVLKMFRLAQLAVEYQQFCRHYLDRSVYVLREEISSLMQELDLTKKDLREKEEEIKKLRRKTKHTYRTPLPYGNDNIANMILKTLTNRNDMFASTSNVDTMQYNKCSYCEKVFLNQLYLKSHISRRHTNVMEIPENDRAENIQSTLNNKENAKLSDELMELRAKLKEMEAIIINTVSNQNKEENKSTEYINNEDKIEIGKNVSKNMKDVEVSTNSEDYLLDKIEEWKKEEHEKYNKEIMLLRNQIMETISSFKEKESKTIVQNELNIIDQLHATIRQQGTEILALKQELNDSKSKAANENAQRFKEAEEQMTIWGKRAEEQTKQYELLLKKLNDVAKEAQESRNQAEKEKEKVAQLQAILEEQLHKNNSNDNENISSDIEEDPKPGNKKNHFKGNGKLSATLINTGNPIRKSTPLADRNALEKLHLKAQELLSIASISSSSSDVSSTEINKPIIQKQKPTNIKQDQLKQRKDISDFNKQDIKNIEKASNNLINSIKNKSKESLKLKEASTKKDKIKSRSKVVTNGPIVVPRSPSKLVRAKLIEEVNNRLIMAGMDPLKNRLPKSIFQKQRLLLQQQHELKSKKNSDHDKIRHTILAYLDSSVIKKKNAIPDDYVSPDKVSKFSSITSVLSNVKSKALSLVKSNDNQIKHKPLNSDMTKRAMSLLKTPPGSAHSSPIIKQHSPIKKNLEKEKELNHNSNHEVKNNNAYKNKTKKRQTLATSSALDTSNSDSAENDHKYYKAVVQQSSKTVENLIKSPARRPSSANSDYKNAVKKYAFDADVNTIHSQSKATISNYQNDFTNDKLIKDDKIVEKYDSSEESLKNVALVKAISEENIHNPKQTKGVLKSASSMSSLNKKKVLFDMDAIQMKSVSASPSQSITEKSDSNEKYELGLINLDGEEWDISSIENEPLKTAAKIQVNTRTSPKIAELKQTIESQLARRNDTPSTVLVGGVDVLSGQMIKASCIGGSNTSLGSSILDDSDSIPATNHKAFVKPKNVPQKDDSELDISEFSIDGLGNKNESF
ncbi:cilium assembly protein DZIP1 [Galleria mellonella]|uniref:Cilium assembly protein DZIP1 n=1 Tax=Galleria mellonella TaxID=7137 RepID=A0A6J1X9A9_GALME|nr:cilium assembly protein DZIP1 [Galleria mellonella]